MQVLQEDSVSHPIASLRNATTSGGEDKLARAAALVSVSNRIRHEDVPRLLAAAYDPTEAPIEYALKQIRLVDEVQRLISTKGLVPTIRSQCYRSAFARADSTATGACFVWGPRCWPATRS